MGNCCGDTKDTLEKEANKNAEIESGSLQTSNRQRYIITTNNPDEKSDSLIYEGDLKKPNNRREEKKSSLGKLNIKQNDNEDNNRGKIVKSE